MLALCREAEEGYNACKTCGFENFKRFPFCSLCGDEIEAWKDAHEKKQTERRAEILKGRNSLWNARSVRSAIATIGILNRQDLQQQQQQWSIPTQRQQRVRLVPCVFRCNWSIAMCLLMGILRFL